MYTHPYNFPILNTSNFKHIVASHDNKSIPFRFYTKVCNSVGGDLRNIDKNKLTPHIAKSTQLVLRSKNLLSQSLINIMEFLRFKQFQNLNFILPLKFLVGATPRSEPNLGFIKNPVFRFRVSGHYFPIESMRCTNLIRNQQFCLSCDMHETENLLHCIFNVKVYF